MCRSGPGYTDPSLIQLILTSIVVVLLSLTSPVSCITKVLLHQVRGCGVTTEVSVLATFRRPIG